MNNAYPIARDYRIGEKVGTLQLIHHERFEPRWIEYHHPRLTRVYLAALRANCLEVPYNNGLYRPVGDFDLEDLRHTMFDWIQ